MDSACAAISGLTGPLVNQAVIVRAGAVPRIVAALAHHPASATVQETALRALWNLSEDASVVADIVAAGALRPVLRALDSFNMNGNVQVAGIGALMNLAVNAECRVSRFCPSRSVEVFEL